MRPSANVKGGGERENQLLVAFRKKQPPLLLLLIALLYERTSSQTWEEEDTRDKKNILFLFQFRNWETSTLKCLSIFRVKGVPPTQSQSHLLDIGRREPLLSHHPLDPIFSEFLLPPFPHIWGRKRREAEKRSFIFFSPLWRKSKRGKEEWGPSGIFFWLLTHRPCYRILSSCFGSKSWF